MLSISLCAFFIQLLDKRLPFKNELILIRNFRNLGFGVKMTEKSKLGKENNEEII